MTSSRAYSICSFCFLQICSTSNIYSIQMRQQFDEVSLSYKILRKCSLFQIYVCYLCLCVCVCILSFNFTSIKFIWECQTQIETQITPSYEIKFENIVMSAMQIADFALFSISLFLWILSFYKLKLLRNSIYIYWERDKRHRTHYYHLKSIMLFLLFIWVEKIILYIKFCIIFLFVCKQS